MSHFLRDQYLNNLTLSEESLDQINSVFIGRALTPNANINELDEEGVQKAFLTYIIRFDNKGYRVFNIQELKQYFNQAKEVERVIFTLETSESLQSNRLIGTYLELRLDGREPNACLLSVTADDKDWVDASFSAVQDVLMKCKNKNGWIRTSWTQFGVQIMGVFIGFALSLWAAKKIAPQFSIDNSFLITFLFLLLIFSNIWVFMNQKILWYIGVIFPNVKFIRPNKYSVHWFLQTLISTIFIAAGLFVFGKIWAFLVTILGSILNNTT